MKRMKRDKSKISFARKLRREMTDAERKLWYQLRSRRFSDVKFRRQHPIEPYITDFCCLERGLVIELDGGQHNDDATIEYDHRRTAFLNSKGFQVIRFWDFEALKETDWVMERIWDALHPEDQEAPSPYPSPAEAGEGKEIPCASEIPFPLPSGERVSKGPHQNDEL